MPDVLRASAASAVFLAMLCIGVQGNAATAADAAATAKAPCPTPPRAPQMPQGATASEEDMREGKERLQTYVDVLQNYQACLEKLIENAPPDTKPELKAQWQANANVAIDAAHEIADVFAIQLKVYKARQ